MKLFLSLFLFVSLFAQEAAPVKSEYELAIEEAKQNLILGAKEVDLDGIAKLNLSQDHAFIPKKSAIRLMESFGNFGNNNLVGLVYPPTGDGYISIDYIKSGYIKDEDAKDFNFNELLQSIKDATSNLNETRKKQGFPEMFVTKWSHQPTYDPAKNKLIYGIEIEEKPKANNSANTINYRNMILGRDGYFLVSLISLSNKIEKDKEFFLNTIENIKYNDGKKYSDFNASTDIVAEYGLAALIAGVTAKKLGFFGLIAALAVKFGKLVIVGLLAVVAIFKKFFNKKKE